MENHIYYFNRKEKIITTCKWLELITAGCYRQNNLKSSSSTFSRNWTLSREMTDYKFAMLLLWLSRCVNKWGKVERVTRISFYNLKKTLIISTYLQTLFIFHSYTLLSKTLKIYIWWWTIWQVNKTCCNVFINST